jgi:hypothetical protein
MGWLIRNRSRERGEFTDLVLAHGSGSFNVHRIIVCSQSSFFRKACTSGFKVLVVFIRQSELILLTRADSAL